MSDDRLRPLFFPRDQESQSAGLINGIMINKLKCSTRNSVRKVFKIVDKGSRMLKWIFV